MVVYGIYIDEELVYIGKTERDIKQRFREHKKNIDRMDKGEYKGSQENLYACLNEAKKQGKYVHLRPMIDLSEVKCSIMLRDWELQAMELGLISYFRPRLNIEGTIKDYNFRY